MAFSSQVLVLQRRLVLVKKVAALMPTSLKIPMTGAGAAATVEVV